MLLTAGSEPWFHNLRNVAALLRLIGYALIAVGAVVGGWWRKRRDKVAQNWPAIEGHVQSCSIAPLRNGSYAATFQYSYFVEEYRSGEYTEVFDSEGEADKFVQMMKDQKVPVRYNPRKPDDSLIENEDVEQYIQLPTPPRLTPLK